MSDKPIDSVDFLFLGLGAANCLLLLNLQHLGLLVDKTIAIIEPNQNSLNERNFCFWASEEEVIDLNLRSLISSKWNKINVAGRETQTISPLYYHHIKGFDLISNVLELLKEHQVHFYTEGFFGEPELISEAFVISLNSVTLIAEHVFDSRPPKYAALEKNESHLLQSFYGWTLKTENSVFDQSTMVMMDFEIPQNDFCQFMYVLPFTDKTALFEVTRFGEARITKQEAEIILKNYVAQLGFEYHIIEQEQGVIPMSSAAIANPTYGPKWLNTGANANMVKPTTGYAFNNMAIDAKSTAESILTQQAYNRKIPKGRFKFYDGLLLKILEKKPLKGKHIFESLFKQTSILQVLNFLSEKSTIRNEINLFLKLPVFIFLLAAINDISYRISRVSPVLVAFSATTLMVLLSIINQEEIIYAFLVLGFFTVGLSHGAVDHLISLKSTGLNQLIKFSLKYIFKGVLLGILWFLVPDLALVAFLFFSAWHFGQTDFNEWKIRNNAASFLWGGLVLLIILFFHLEETQVVLETIQGLQLVSFVKGLAPYEIQSFQVVIVSLSILIATFYQSKHMFLTIAYLIISSYLSLFASFGIYFVLQHSLHGWGHLKTSLKVNSYQLWLKALPFSIGGAIIISMFMLSDFSGYLGLFFILLSCLSLPHVISMNRFYGR